MRDWKITSVSFGGQKKVRMNDLDGGNPKNKDLFIDTPYTSYILRNGKETILVDTGLSDKMIVDGIGWGGYVTAGGEQAVLDALRSEGLTPADIDTVILTHLHLDHAGNIQLFKDARIIVQKEEIDECCNPLPHNRILGSFDPETMPKLWASRHLYIVDGDVDLGNGLKLCKIPGHTRGSQCIVVPTAEGRYVVTGDMPHVSISLFPQLTEMKTLDGGVLTISSQEDARIPYIMSSFIPNMYTTYASYDRLKLLAEAFEPKWYLTGHDPWCIIKHTWG